MYILKAASGQITVFDERLIVFHFPTKNIYQIKKFQIKLKSLFAYPFISPNIFSKLDHQISLNFAYKKIFAQKIGKIDKK